MANTNLVPVNNGTICVFNDPKIGDMYTSFSPDSMEGKKLLYNAINSPDCRIADYINTPITLKDVVVSRVKLASKVDASGDTWAEDDKERDGFRVILIDTDGKSYTATSTGIYNSVGTLRSVFGTLHFEDGMPVVIKQIKTKNGNTLTLALA